jgi:hypothetical protein
MVSAPSFPAELAPDRALAVAPEAEGACAMCPHPLADHDAISLRFCRATEAQATTRGCVCPSA